MSNEVELPPLECTDADRSFADLWESAYIDKHSYVRMLGCRERQLREDIARAEKAETELATAKSDLDMEVARLLKAQDLQIEATAQARNEAASESLWRKRAERERDVLKSELAEIRGITHRHILTSRTGEQDVCGGPGLCKWCDAGGGDEDDN